MQHNSYRRWITLAIISFSGGVSFDLAYLRYIYQIPMAKFMGFSNTEIGLIMSTFGIAAIILYAPSGVIADKFSHRKMITSAMIITGLLGLLMATYPPLWVMLCIQIAFAITTILMLWSVSIKEGANKQVISSQADSLIKISRIWADFFPANTSNQPI